LIATKDMMYKHSETTWSIQRLTNGVNNISSHVTVAGDIIGHFKKIWDKDPTFDVTNIDGTAYKFSVKWKVDVKSWDRLIINSGVFSWEYSVQDFRYTEGITFNVTKIFVVI